MSECSGKLMIYKGEVVSCETVSTELFYPIDSVYEVIRVIKGVPLFVEDHIDRLRMSLDLSGKSWPDGVEMFKDEIRELVRRNGIRDGNIKITIAFTDTDHYSLLHFIEAVYPGPELYKKGIDLVLYRAVRRNPMAKVSNFNLRAQIYDKLVREGAYEAVLVKDDNTLTEGSKSNIFFIMGNTVITAPDNEVLCGITRKRVITICDREGIAIEFSNLSLDELARVDSIFITGTSPQVLGVRSIEGHNYCIDHPLLVRISEMYGRMVDDYISKLHE